MSVQIGRLAAADKKPRNQQPRDRATLLALMAGVLWGLGLLQYALFACRPEMMRTKMAEASVPPSFSKGFGDRAQPSLGSDNR
jgi:hypothetical protein